MTDSWREANPTPSTKPPHPLQQIAENAAHKLLLKQWLKETELIGRRAEAKQSRLDAVRREIAHLYCVFFVFHATVLLILFSAAALNPTASCRRSWLPCLSSLLGSMAIVWAIRYKTDSEAHLEKQLEREMEDELLLGKCVAELKKKGKEFDLLKEVDDLRRAKSLRLGAKGTELVKKWSKRDFVLMFFFAASCGVLGLTRFVLCSNY
ncbi:hypothetical protein HPP92_000809 [Vanilla planifolia]|uniref:Uncharacterized protein n=1 Tax=Vanilla planifolia TaxID=51239 RepID=A0A835VH47_VANPL|nr:hypothetical protein HPP92_000947 [Vanilla planifolia]KAG0500737.1 hypothetical protein HPP92_000809 [Vanilla planifolia]